MRTELITIETDTTPLDGAYYELDQRAPLWGKPRFSKTGQDGPAALVRRCGPLDPRPRPPARYRGPPGRRRWHRAGPGPYRRIRHRQVHRAARPSVSALLVGRPGTARPWRCLCPHVFAGWRMTAGA